MRTDRTLPDSSIEHAVVPAERRVGDLCAAWVQAKVNKQVIRITYFYERRAAQGMLWIIGISAMKSRPRNVIHVSDVTPVKSAAWHEDLASGLQIIKISGGGRRGSGDVTFIATVCLCW